MRRLWIYLGAVPALLFSIIVPVAPGAAVADAASFGPIIPCPTDPNIVWRTVFMAKNATGFEGIRYDVLTATSFFAVSDGRFVDNGLDTPIQATFTSQQSRTIAVTATIGSNAQLTEKLQQTVSNAIQIARTTSIGVSATVTVAPRSRITGEYGTQAWDVAYTGQVVWKRRDGERCWDRGSRSGTTFAPTVNEGWRFS